MAGCAGEKCNVCIMWEYTSWAKIQQWIHKLMLGGEHTDIFFMPDFMPSGLWSWLLTDYPESSRKHKIIFVVIWV